MHYIYNLYIYYVYIYYIYTMYICTIYILYIYTIYIVLRIYALYIYSIYILCIYIYHLYHKAWKLGGCRILQRLHVLSRTSPWWISTQSWSLGADATFVISGGFQWMGISQMDGLQWEILLRPYGDIQIYKWMVYNGWFGEKPHGNLHMVLVIGHLYDGNIMFISW